MRWTKKTQAKMDSLSKLRRRKADLKTQIEQERNDLKETFQAVRQEIEPVNLLKKAVSGALGFSKKKPGDPSTSILGQMPAPISFLVDVLVKDPKWALGLKLITPVVLKYFPRSSKPKVPAAEDGPQTTVKTKFLSQLRRGISSLRGKLQKQESPVAKAPENITDQPEN
jgi:hypothetical protein